MVLREGYWFLEISKFEAENFNPHTLVGVTILSMFILELIIFQSTHREGCDLLKNHGIMMRAMHFNPHTREGCDNRRSTNSMRNIDIYKLYTNQLQKTENE